MRRPAYLVSTIFWCHKHGHSEMVRGYAEDHSLTNSGGDLFPCACWYELEDGWHGGVEKKVLTDDDRQIDIWS